MSKSVERRSSHKDVESMLRNGRPAVVKIPSGALVKLKQYYTAIEDAKRHYNAAVALVLSSLEIDATKLKNINLDTGEITYG